MNTDFARRQMVEQQVRTWEVYEPRVLATLATLSREQFVPPMYADLAYADTDIPLSHGQSMLRPTVEGRILQSLNLEHDDDVLEIGTGCGYLSACIASLAGSVTSIEIYADLVAAAEKNLDDAEIDNVQLHCMDAMSQLPEGEFTAILVGGSAPILHERFIERLLPGGRMITVVGEPPVKYAILVTRGSSDDCRRDREIEYIFETDIPELLNAPQIEPFSF